uniref:Uncharacterized protein n=1 Tax=Engystomops pustulosus TaxID=76066 RepID=A0AAV6YH65_ENGPU|nr:hypothetical protein GDO81_026370 [Engystomops pustulosus]
MHTHLPGGFDQGPGRLFAAVDGLPKAGLEVHVHPCGSPVGAGAERRPAELQERGLHVRDLREISDGRAVHGGGHRHLVLPALHGGGGAQDLPDLGL